MWALGVVLFTMLYGQFPFYDSSPTQLFSKIKAADYSIPRQVNVVCGDFTVKSQCDKFFSVRQIS